LVNVSTDRRKGGGVRVRPVHERKTLIRTDELHSREGMTVTLKDFYADWCGPCKTQDPILEGLEEKWDDVEFEKINVDEQQDVANEYQVRSLPTLIVENDDGIVERFVGVTQADDLEDALESASV
jgi:thioredoxin 1